MARAAAWCQALQLLALAPGARNVALKALATARRWRQALHLVHDVDVVGLGAAVTACHGRDLWPVALGLLAQAPELNVVACNAALKSCELSAAWVAALAVLQAMQERRLRPDELSYGAVSSSCGRAGHWPLSLGFLHLAEHGSSLLDSPSKAVLRRTRLERGDRRLRSQLAAGAASLGGHGAPAAPQQHPHLGRRARRMSDVGAVAKGPRPA